MNKRNKLVMFEEYYETARLRWEFIRRNKNYKEIYRNFLELFEKSKDKFDDFDLVDIPVLEGLCFDTRSSFISTEAYMLARSVAEECGFSIFKHRILPDPELSFEHDVVKDSFILKTDSGFDYPYVVSDIVRCEFRKVQTYEKFGYLPVLLPEELFSIHVDFSRLNSKAALKKIVNEMIDYGYSRYKQENKVKKVLKKKDYELILKAGDLYESGLKHREIAQQLLPGKYKKNPESTTRSISDYLKKYNDFVYGEFMKLNFP